MDRDVNFQFIREKISKIRTAVMYTMSNSLVKLPNDVVTLVTIDEDANLWFLSRQPLQLPDQCEQEFPARLCFYRKGINFYVEVSGKASVISNSYKVEASGKLSDEKIPNQKPMLIRMSMNNIEYKEPDAQESKRLESWFRNAYKWLLRHIAISRTPIFSKLHKTN